MRTTTAVLAASLAAASVGWLLNATAQDASPSEPAASPALLPSAHQRRLSLPASRAMPLARKAPGPSEEDVGDVDSFGRNVTWLGVAQMNVSLLDSCPKPDPAANAACAELLPAPASTAFDVQDVARIKLPPKATHSILCHWFSPLLSIRYRNPTAGPVVARLNTLPTLTIENPVLDDPSLVDPTTGLPFAGRLTTSMSASELFEVPLSPGMALNARERDTATCIAGFLTRKSLVGTWGLTPVQADKFFANETTIRMNLRGSAQYVEHASLIFGLRIVGD